MSVPDEWRPRTFGPKQERELDDRFLLDTGGNVGHESQILDQTACFSFWSIACAQHAPLTRLQSSRPRDLSRLFKLRADTGHHSEGRYETQAAEDMSNPSTLHSESLDVPVPGG